MGNQTATATPAPATPATTATTAGVVTLLTAVATFARYHTRAALAFCSYHVAGLAGIVFMPARMFANSTPPATLQFTATAPDGPHTMLTYRGMVAGTRPTYTATGLAGTIVVHGTLLPGVPPATLYVNVALATATPRKAGKATSAIVAGANVAAAAAAGTPDVVATPATVATVAGVAGAAVVATVAAAGKATPATTAGVAAGKAAAAAVLAGNANRRKK